MTPCTETAERLAGDCAEVRAERAAVEAANPVSAERVRKLAGPMPVYADDPLLTVRASDLEALCAVAVAVAPLVALCLDTDGWTPDQAEAAESAAGLVAPLLGVQP